MKFKLIKPIIATKGSKFLKGLGGRLNDWGEQLAYAQSLTAKEREILFKNKQLKNIHKGKRAFIIANGPSIKTQDLSLLSNDITFTMSGFYKHPILKVWQPNYYFVLDPHFFNNPETFKPLYEGVRENIPDATYFLPLSRGYHFMKKYDLLPEEKTFLCASYGEREIDDLDFSQVTSGFRTVAAFAMAMAIYMGCDPIYLIGFDHDYLANTGVDQHFYQGTIAGGKVGEKYQKQRVHDIFAYDELMSMMQDFWRNYRYLKAQADKKGITIYNATNGGFLDVFERADFEKINFDNK